MTEPGSDELLRESPADPGAVRRLVRDESVRQAIEEWRVSHAPLADEEPGDDHPDPDEAPPPDEAHDEYDTTPKEP